MIGLKKGDKVIVNVPLHEQSVHTSAAKYNGQEMKIARRVAHFSGTRVYYELVGAESEYGVPYGFTKDWLIEL